MPRPLDIVGLAEAAALTGRQKSSIARSVRMGTFPHPDAELECGPVWRRQTILQRVRDGRTDDTTGSDQSRD